jgi:hypothetical protein
MLQPDEEADEAYEEEEKTETGEEEMDSEDHDEL